ncbi:hypothetical protein [Mycolicibacterium sp. NCC-Tsukiji]|uniref:hypothetical protein n=1 Tax=Mycobacteriaceae TaxID=1762 RepID=UPI000EEF1181|nr:hypothetical protein [Mycolicibacterium sp. NCC-Tsukiji]GCA99099.1 hypothetical protein NCCNTM_27340 [Mycolicibacterium sp. NCC-Tsukiji]
MRRDDVLLTVAGLSVSVFLMIAGPSMAIAAADPGGSNGNGGNSSSGKTGSGKSSSPRGNAGNGNSGNGGSRGNSGANSSVSGQTNTGKSSKANGKSNNTAPGASGSDNPATVPMFKPPNPPVPVIVAEQHTGTSPGGTWWGAPGAPQPIIEVHELSVPSEEGDADLLSADHTGIPVWAAAEPVGLRGDLFGLAGLVLMPLIGLAVGYRQAKAARDIGQTLPS